MKYFDIIQTSRLHLWVGLWGLILAVGATFYTHSAETEASAEPVPAVATPLSPKNAQFANRIDEILDGPYARSAIWGVHIQDLNTGRLVYSRNSDKTLVPASNQKLLTAAAALSILGSDFRFETTLHLKGDIQDGVLRGDLILEGSGDPTFASKEVDGENPLQTWAKELAERGVTQIEGRLIGDDNAFDEEPYPEGWDISFISSQAFAPASGGLSSHDNVVVVQIRSSRVGAAPTIDDNPAGYLTIQNQATTSARRRGRSISVNRILGTEEILMKGSIPRVYRRSVVIPVSNPTNLTLHAFKKYLEEAGIEVKSELIDVDNMAQALTYKGANPLFVYHSPFLPEILVEVNKSSNNFYAEQVFRAFSWGGSTSGGQKRVKEWLRREGMSIAGLSVRDGSGLSRKNMITPETMGQLLAFMNTHPDRTAFMASLARGGESKTTLDYRLRGVPIWAKTGSLEYVRALSGYALTQDGRLYAFTMLANNYTVPAYRIMQAMDSVVLAITESADA